MEDKQAQAAPSTEEGHEAFNRYAKALSETDPEGYKLLMTNSTRYVNTEGLFAYAKSWAELDSYMDKTLDELAEVMAQKEEERWEQDPFLREYRLSEAHESAFISYELALHKADPEGWRAFQADEELFETILNLFYATKSQAEMDSYMDKTLDELAEIAAQAGIIPMITRERARRAAEKNGQTGQTEENK